MENQELINQTQSLLADPAIPDWAKIFGALLSILVIGVSAWLGRRRAAEPETTSKNGKTVVLEGALVDSSAIKVLSGSVEALGISVKSAEIVLQKNSELLSQSLEFMRRSQDMERKLTQSMDDVADQLDRQRSSRDELTHEMRELRVQMGIFAATLTRTRN